MKPETLLDILYDKLTTTVRSTVGHVPPLRRGFDHRPNGALTSVGKFTRLLGLSSVTCRSSRCFYAPFFLVRGVATNDFQMYVTYILMLFIIIISNLRIPIGIYQG